MNVKLINLIRLFLLPLGGFVRWAVLLMMIASLLQPTPVYAADLTVNTLDDELNNDGDCSLREAITAASENISVDACPAGDAAGTDTISFAVSGPVGLTSQLEIHAGGPLLIDGGGMIMVSGGGSVRVLYLHAASDVTLRNLSILNGQAENGAGIYNEAGTLNITNSVLSGNYANDLGGYGGGIYNLGALNINESILSGNRAFDSGGAITNFGTITLMNSTLSENVGIYFGGGVSNFGTLTVTNSTFSNNNTGRFGGGIDNSGTLVINNSTLSGNTAGHHGGGVYNFLGTLNINYSTLSGNFAPDLGSAIYTYPSTATLNSNVIAYNSSSDNCIGGIIDAGYNIEDANTCGLNPANHSLHNTDPLLGPLQDNGGPTLTHALLPGSPAIEAGNPLNCPSADQRGVVRPLDGNHDGIAACDMGAYEFVAATVDITPSTISLPSKGIWVTAYIELPTGFDVAAIDLSTVLLQGTIPAATQVAKVGDHDKDGNPDIMVQFSQPALLVQLGGLTGEVRLLVMGRLRDNTPFSGWDTIIVGQKK